MHKLLLANTLVLHSLDLFDPRDVGNLALEPGLDLASGQGERQQQEDNLILWDTDVNIVL